MSLISSPSPPLPFGGVSVAVLRCLVCVVWCRMLNVSLLSQFMKYANVKKMRITDLFRRMDTDNDTFLDKEEFIDGMTKTSTYHQLHAAAGSPVCLLA